jgi:SAM-dependent methyltransferase
VAAGSERIVHLYHAIAQRWLDRPSVIIDRERKLGRFDVNDVGYATSLKKEEVAREHVFGMEGHGLQFLDIGARDAQLDYLLGITSNLDIDRSMYAANRRRFEAKYRYWGLDLLPEDEESVIAADICDERLLERRPDLAGFFDVAYSNNVFEHLRRPWVAAANIMQMLKPGGICITITPFSLRYHESPGDYFRYTHTGLVALFEDDGPVRTLVSGYDITGRRNNWQGLGGANDIVPVDRFGAWRENWFVIAIVQKQAT